MKKGFTLIELLVVVAIIAILAAILFPVFAKVREKSRQASCSSNEKQLGLGFIQYIQDYDEKWPVSVAGGNKVGWAGSIYTYIKSTGVYKCPDSAGAAPLIGYFYNENLYSLNPQVQNTPMSPAQLTSPVRTVVLFEAVGYTGDVTVPGEQYSLSHNCYFGVANVSGYGDNGGWATGAIDNCYWSRPGNMAVGSGTNLPTGLHTDGANYLAADGHVKWLRGAAVSGGNNASSTNAGNPDCSAYTTTSAQSGDATGTCAEGASYGGTGSHALTLSAI